MTAPTDLWQYTQPDLPLAWCHGSLLVLCVVVKHGRQLRVHVLNDLLYLSAVLGIRFDKAFRLYRLDSQENGLRIPIILIQNLCKAQLHSVNLEGTIYGCRQSQILQPASCILHSPSSLPQIEGSVAHASEVENQ